VFVQLGWGETEACYGPHLGSRWAGIPQGRHEEKGRDPLEAAFLAPGVSINRGDRGGRKGRAVRGFPRAFSFSSSIEKNPH